MWDQVNAGEGRNSAYVNYSTIEGAVSAIASVSEGLTYKKTKLVRLRLRKKDSGLLNDLM